MRNRTNLIDRDWDILIILDACRFDTFKKFNTMRGKLTSILSLGTDTKTWMERTFKTEEHDIIYVSANPFITTRGMANNPNPPKCHEIIELWKTHWHDELMTVIPSAVNNFIRGRFSKLRNKRMIIHYMQPHHPFIASNFHWIHTLRQLRLREFEKDPDGNITNVWDWVIAGKISPEEIKEAYEANVINVLSYVGELIKILKGKIVISADHGNLLGEYGEWAHPKDKDYPELLEVPFLEVEK